MHDRIRKLFQTSTQPFLRNGMSLTYCYEQSKRESVGSYVKAKGSQKQPNGSKNKQGEKRFPTRIKTTGNERYKDFGTQHKRNESPAYNRKYGHKWHHFESVCMAKHLQESHDSSVSQTLISYIESFGNRLFATLSFFCEHNNLKTMLQCQLDTAATCHVLNYRDLSIIKQEGNPPMERGKT